MNLDINRLQAEMDKLVEIGPKLTGSKDHTKYIEYLKSEIKNMGLPVYVDPFFFDRWEAKNYSLKVNIDGEMKDIPVSSPHPYSGETGKDGVEGELVYLGSAFRPFGIKGKIPVIKMTNLSMLPSTLAFNARSAYPADTAIPDHYTGPVATAMVKCLMEGMMKSGKPAAAVFVWNKLPDKVAQGQVMPFIQDYLGIPVLWVNESNGEKVIAAAKKHKKAILTLEAEKEERAYTESFYTIIPGKNRKESIIVNTHTDGPNCVEENGPAALLEMLRCVKDKPLERTHIFLFTTGHFRLPVFKELSTGSFQSVSKWLAMHRNLWDGKKENVKCVANLTIEHLGCMEWICNGKDYIPTGKPEIELVYTGNKFMDQLYLSTVAETRKNTRSFTLRGHNMLHFGEGQNLFTMGIPGICLVPAPFYLCVQSDNMEIDKFNMELMHEQVETFLTLLEKYEKTPTKAFGKSDGYSLLFARKHAKPFSLNKK